MKKILIIEDEPMIRSNLATTAIRMNPDIQVLQSDSAAEALELAKNHTITAFFIDIQLVDYSGLELAKQLRGVKKYAFTPIVFITAIPTRELEAFRQIHCYDYIIKPFAQRELEATFKKIVIDYVEQNSYEEKTKLSLRFKGYNIFIDQKEITYVEYVNRKIMIHTVRESIEYIHMPLKIFKKELNNHFMQIHQSIIINKQLVERVELNKQLLKLQGVERLVPIGRSYRAKVGERIHEFS